MKEKNKLRALVNKSGFPLQLAVAHLVRSEPSLSHWNVFYEEHGWQDDRSQGFIDLVLEDQDKTWLLNIECKRVRDSTWLFLVDAKPNPKPKTVSLFISHRRSGERDLVTHFDWVDVPMMTPNRLVSKICVMGKIPAPEN